MLSFIGDLDAISPGMATVLRYLAERGGCRSVTRYRDARPGEFHGKTIGALMRRG